MSEMEIDWGRKINWIEAWASKKDGDKEKEEGDTGKEKIIPKICISLVFC